MRQRTVVIVDGMYIPADVISKLFYVTFRRTGLGDRLMRGECAVSRQLARTRASTFILVTGDIK